MKIGDLVQIKGTAAGYFGRQFRGHLGTILEIDRGSVCITAFLCLVSILLRKNIEPYIGWYWDFDLTSMELNGLQKLKIRLEKKNE